MSTSTRPVARGILAPADILDRWLSVVLFVLLGSCAMRYFARHGIGTSSWAVLAGAGALALAYWSRRLWAGGPSWAPTAWVAAVVALWTVLTLSAPSFAWTAVPLAFAALQVLAFRHAVGVVVFMTAVVGVAGVRISDGFDPTLVAGPLGMGLLTVLAYRALEREAQTRQRLLDDLTAAQSQLSAVQRRSGALAERTRLSRDIHDSVGQGLSSINLLLNAAEEDWDHRPHTARQHVRTAATTAREGLDEVRRVVRDLAPTALAAAGSADALADALQKLLDRSGPAVTTALRTDGMPRVISESLAGAVVHTASGALANAFEHARASRVVLTLTYLPDQVILDIRDDGKGFEPAASRRRGARGHGIPGMRDRATALGGRLTVESAPGEGTCVSLALPTPSPD
jgi:signal transduction histidine kinase